MLSETQEMRLKGQCDEAPLQIYQKSFSLLFYSFCFGLIIKWKKKELSIKRKTDQLQNDC